MGADGEELMRKQVQLVDPSGKTFGTAQKAVSPKEKRKNKNKGGRRKSNYPEYMNNSNTKKERRLSSPRATTLSVASTTTIEESPQHIPQEEQIQVRSRLVIGQYCYKKFDVIWI